MVHASCSAAAPDESLLSRYGLRMSGELQGAVDGIGRQMARARFSCSVVDVASGKTQAERKGETERPTASIGKLILLVEIADRMAHDPSFGDRLLDRASVEPVADSGLWQHLRTARLPVADLAALVGSVSDNLATNVLLQEVGLAAVERRAVMLHLRETRLHDFVRDERTDAHPKHLSSGTTSELAGLMRRLWQAAQEPGPERQVLDWLRLGVDHSMVAGAFGLDPLAHAEPDRGLELLSKTGTAKGVRADVGVAAGPASAVAYAAIAQWPTVDATDTRDTVLAGLRALGVAIRRHVEASAP